MPRCNDGSTSSPTHRVNAYEEKESESEAMLFEHLIINTAGLGGRANAEDTCQPHQQLVKKGTVNGESVKV
ncbi:hypothetical protein PI126_g15723 [Phytophthora idaei]|nr:hypothetical protein PI126_g15723 [Phytophthora idaei]